MSEAIDLAFKSLAQWPMVQGFFLIVITFLGLAAMRRGEKDRHFNTNNIEIPVYLMTGPVHDAMGEIRSILEECKKTNDLLKRHSHLLENLNKFKSNNENKLI